VKLALRPYQEKATDFLYERDRAMILAPVGAGKTAITLTAMDDLIYDGAADRFLVLAPKRVCTSVWPVEGLKWALCLNIGVAVGTSKQRQDVLHDQTYNVVVMNYDNLQWLVGQDLSSFDAIVFDELTKLKNPSGKRFKALMRVIEGRFLATVLRLHKPRLRRLVATQGGARVSHAAYQAGHLRAGARRVPRQTAAVPCRRDALPDRGSQTVRDNEARLRGRVPRCAGGRC